MQIQLAGRLNKLIDVGGFEDNYVLNREQDVLKEFALLKQ
jgi:hypothetical protein